MNHCANQQIVAAYEKCGLTVEDIAENYELEPEAVKLALLSGSHKYRMEQKALEEGGVTPADVTADEMAEMLSIIKSIAREQRYDNPAVAEKAAKFVYNEGKGRNNVVSAMANNGINVLVINQRLVGMKQAREKVLGGRVSEPAAILDA